MNKKRKTKTGKDGGAASKIASPGARETALTTPATSDGEFDRFPVMTGPKALPTLKRAEADRLLAQVIKRAKYINANPQEYPARVTLLVVFGSYLTDKPVLGDLDIAVEMEAAGPGEPDAGNEPFEAFVLTMEALRIDRPRLVRVCGMHEVEHMQAPYKEVLREVRILRETNKLVVPVPGKAPKDT